MTTIDTIRAVYSNPAATLDELTAAAEAARSLALSCATAAAVLNERRPDVLLEGSDKDLAKVDADLAQASRTVERAGALAIACDTRAAEIRALSEEQRRRVRYDEAHKASADLAASMPAKYRQLVELARSILADIGEARRKVFAANRDLPEGAATLPDAEAFRHKASRASIVSKEPLMLWCRDNGTPLPPDVQGKVHATGDGEGRIAAHWTSATDEETYYRKPAWRVTVQPETAYPLLRPFDVELAIPPLFSGEAPGWRQNSNHPEPITTRLAALLDHEPPRAPETIVEIVSEKGLDDLKARHRIV